MGITWLPLCNLNVPRARVAVASSLGLFCCLLLLIDFGWELLCFLFGIILFYFFFLVLLLLFLVVSAWNQLENAPNDFPDCALLKWPNCTTSGIWVVPFDSYANLCHRGVSRPFPWATKVTTVAMECSLLLAPQVARYRFCRLHPIDLRVALTPSGCTPNNQR